MLPRRRLYGGGSVRVACAAKGCDRETTEPDRDGWARIIHIDENADTGLRVCPMCMWDAAGGDQEEEEPAR